MLTRFTKPIILFCVLLQAIEAPRAFAEQSPKPKNVETVTINGHEITTGDLVLGGTVAHIVVGRTLNGLQRGYFEIRDSEFDKAAAKLMSKRAEKVLFISSFSKDDVFRSTSEMRFQKLYGNHPNALYLEVSSPKELISKLKALPQDSSFDRIEIDMHGNKGVLGFSDKTLLMRHDHPWFSKDQSDFDVEEFKRANLQIAKPGADLRISACRIADEGKSGKPLGTDFLNDFGKSLMPEGGRVFSTEKIVLPTKFNVVTKIPIFGVLLHAAELTGDIIKYKMPKGFRFRKDVVQIDIPPKAPSCAPEIIQALQKAL
ncbi:MAG: hypothetical protein ACJ763_06840 [Bdellovibrionia bacterium]